MDRMEQVRRLTQGWGGAAVGVDLLFCFFPFCSGVGWSIILSFHLSAGMKGGGGGAPPSSPMSGGRGDIGSCHTLIRVYTV